MSKSNKENNVEELIRAPVDRGIMVGIVKVTLIKAYSDHVVVELEENGEEERAITMPINEKYNSMTERGDPEWIEYRYISFDGGKKMIVALRTRGVENGKD